MRAFVAIVPLALLLAGCNTDKTYTDLTQSGRGIAQLRMDGGVCDMALQQSAVGGAAPAGANTGLTISNIGTRMIEQDNFYDACMLSRGWQRS